MLRFKDGNTTTAKLLDSKIRSFEYYKNLKT